MDRVSLDLTGDNKDYVDWLLKTKLEPYIKDASCEIPNENMVVFHWDLGPIDMQLDIRLVKREGWLYTSNRKMKMDCLRVFDLYSDIETERMTTCLRDYLNELS